MTVGFLFQFEVKVSLDRTEQNETLVIKTDWIRFGRFGRFPATVKLSWDHLGFVSLGVKSFSVPSVYWSVFIIVVLVTSLQADSPETHFHFQFKTPQRKQLWTRVTLWLDVNSAGSLRWRSDRVDQWLLKNKYWLKLESSWRRSVVIIITEFKDLQSQLFHFNVEFSFVLLKTNVSLFSVTFSSFHFTRVNTDAVLKVSCTCQDSL